ncbi:uncharacterized protein HD556DRAFT_1537310 [Suillus plorans]|uniref:Uncharacterized protein n=1 Tax=Suillus plorans TaxID=116603 RepID=A0A9P7AL19_9AGAM|nr:uncharacterized protein HD556DRAFT_1537310 [Suillus plorans]KAG1791601.1 hypothetical protein HD556DRAFT_1537310 [Suillus plorans]
MSRASRAPYRSTSQIWKEGAHDDRDAHDKVLRHLSVPHIQFQLKLTFCYRWLEQLVSTGIEEAMRDGVMMLPVRTGKMVFEHGILECSEKSYTSYANVMVAYVTNMMTIPPYSYTTPNEKLACSAANPHAHA